MEPSQQLRHRWPRGLPLVEVMIVVVVVGALAAGAGLGVMTARADEHLRVARDEVQNLAQIVEAYQQLGGDRCPSVVQLEQSKLLQRGTHAQDPWGTRYEVVCETEAVNVRSLGPDRIRGTADDIALF
jgi:prepilin-type N-terminal cleavage/methylation domain-containing protein